MNETVCVISYASDANGIEEVEAVRGDVVKAIKYVEGEGRGVLIPGPLVSRLAGNAFAEWVTDGGWYVIDVYEVDGDTCNRVTYEGAKREVGRQ